MSNRDDKPSKPPALPPLGGKKPGNGNTGSGDQRQFGQTLKGLGDLKLPRKRESTSFSPRPGVTQNDEPAPAPSTKKTSAGGWQSVPLTELSIPAPNTAKGRPKKAPAAAPEAADFEDEKTQLGVGLRAPFDAPTPELKIEPLDEIQEIQEIQEIEAIEPLPELEVSPLDIEPLDEFEDEKTQLSSTEAFMKQDQALHKERSTAPTDSTKPFNTPFDPSPAAMSQEIFSSVPDAVQGGSLRGGEALPAPIKTQAPAPAPSPAQAPANSGDDGEFNAEKTEMLNSPFEAGPAVARLHALEGPVAGQEFFVTQMRNTIGRGDNNSIMMADAAMSRQHMEIIKNPDDTYTLRDLQSVNGTMLNGTRVREADLFHGDRIEAGNTVIQFVVQGGVQQPARNRRLVPAAMGTFSGANPAVAQPVSVPQGSAPPQELTKLSTYITIIAGVISLILIVGIIFLLVNSGDGDTDASPELASQHYLTGVEAVKNRKWDDASAEFNKAKELDPKLKIAAQLERITAEKEALANFEALREEAKKGNWDKVASLVDAIPESSVYHEDAKKLAHSRKKIQLDELYADAQAKVTGEDYDAAREVIDNILAESPNHRAALELRDRIDELENESAEPAADDTPDSDAVASARPRDEGDAFELIGAPKKKKESSRSSASSNGGSGDGQKLYASKKFDAAAKAFEREASKASGSAAKKASNAAKDVREFASVYKAGKRHYAIKKWGQARTALKKAYRLDSQIAGGRGPHRSELGGMLAVTEAQLGMNALKSKDYGGARKHLKESEAYDRNADAVRNLRRKIQASAKTLYIKAVNLRKTNAAEAGRLCRNIMALVPASDATHQKAKKLLSEI